MGEGRTRFLSMFSRFHLDLSGVFVVCSRFMRFINLSVMSINKTCFQNSLMSSRNYLY